MDISLIVILSTPIFILLYAIYVIIHEMLLRRKIKKDFLIEINADPQIHEFDEELKRLKEQMF